MLLALTIVFISLKLSTRKIIKNGITKSFEILTEYRLQVLYLKVLLGIHLKCLPYSKSLRLNCSYSQYFDYKVSHNYQFDFSTFKMILFVYLHN